jgi:dephospho-CoA kinase
MLKVALSGGIASGKTSVSDQFQSLGVPVIDADLLSREAVAVGTPGLGSICRRFGADIIDESGALDRKKLRQIVFNNSEARADLESIVHPEVRRLTTEALQRFEDDNAPYCVVVIPLLVETAQQDHYDHVIIVDVGEETQIRRVMQRDGSTEQQARKILESQAKRSQRLAIADTVIDNSGSVESLATQVDTIHQTLLQKAASEQPG